ncbi:hypothetical protein EYF80_008112 [Liparis tanakae]|uniref:Secreted protein n=1 Tax=Liparis tanakae TaxID=230148 RepID=A0A4Z2IUY4_9TELE|nr:hypothetical protein EYF80_008112 [Liparis tanakae]
MSVSFGWLYLEVWLASTALGLYSRVMGGVMPDSGTCVHALVSLAHALYDEVAEVAVEFGPTVDHDAAAHQEHVAQPRSRPVPERDLQRE